MASRAVAPGIDSWQTIGNRRKVKRFSSRPSGKENKSAHRKENRFALKENQAWNRSRQKKTRQVTHFEMIEDLLGNRNEDKTGARKWT